MWRSSAVKCSTWWKAPAGGGEVSEGMGESTQNYVVVIHRSSRREPAANNEFDSILGGVIALRIIIGALIAAAIGVALVPLLVLLDIRSGGTGWGLCPDGIGSCRNSYFAGFELVGFVVVALFVVLALVALCVRLLRIVERRHGIQT
jgi:hypothetical protein